VTRPCRLPRPQVHNAHELSRAPGLGWSPFARRYLGNRCCFPFLGVLRWFTSPRSLHTPYLIQGWMTGLYPAGLPHSEILGSQPVCGSPRLIAAYRVLHRPRAPRHPPYALSSLTMNGHLSPSAFATKPDRLSKNLESAVGPSLPGQWPGRERLRASLVENTGIEPVTSWLQTRRSPN
jgi:hypothetical protein